MVLFYVHIIRKESAMSLQSSLFLTSTKRFFMVFLSRFFLVQRFSLRFNQFPCSLFCYHIYFICVCFANSVGLYILMGQAIKSFSLLLMFSLCFTRKSPSTSFSMVVVEASLFSILHANLTRVFLTGTLQ